MSITVRFRKDTHRIEAETIKAGEILEHLGLSKQSYLIVRDLKLIPEDETVKAGDEVRIIAVISGGSRR